LIDKFYAWAINTRSDEGYGFIGRYWWFKNYPPLIPPHMEGCEKAIFKTRKIARENLPSVKSTFPEAIVAKVLVTIEEVKEEKLFHPGVAEL